MSTRSHSTAYRCSQDCAQMGCPGHDFELTVYSTSDIFGISKDGKERMIGDIALLEQILIAADELGVTRHDGTIR